MQTFNRWAICFKHDNSPLDASVYIHKAQAQKNLETLKNKDKLVVNPVEIRLK